MTQFRLPQLPQTGAGSHDPGCGNEVRYKIHSGDYYMVLTISENDLMWMKGVLLDNDRDESLKIVRELVKRLQIQSGKGLKSHLDGN